jgi:hypothetical protein
VTRELEEAGGPQGSADEREWQESVAPYMREIMAGGDYPHLSAMIAERVTRSTRTRDSPSGSSASSTASPRAFPAILPETATRVS